MSLISSTDLTDKAISFYRIENMSIKRVQTLLSDKTLSSKPYLIIKNTHFHLFRKIGK